MSPSRKRILRAAFSIALVFAACSQDPTESPAPPGPEARVTANASAVASAAVAFAADNNGEHARTPLSLSAGGQTLIDLLPDGKRLVNPYTGIADQPVHPEPGQKGDVSYRGYVVYDGQAVEVVAGYVVETWDEGSTRVLLTNVPDSLLALEDTVRAQCHAVQAAAEEWAVQNGGVYPAGLADAGTGGKSLVDLLPGGTLLRNAFTGAGTEPVDGFAVQRGEVGYTPLQSGGNVIGYCVSGFGATHTIATLCAPGD